MIVLRDPALYTLFLMSGIGLPKTRSSVVQYKMHDAFRFAAITAGFLQRFLTLAEEHQYDARFGDFPLIAAETGPLLAPDHVYSGLRRSRWPVEVSDPAIILNGNDSWHIDSKALVFVSRPGYRYEKRGVRFERVSQPHEAVFVAYLLPLSDTARARQIAEQEGLKDRPQAILIGFEWTEADPRAPSKPMNFDTRYDSCVF